MSASRSCRVPFSPGVGVPFSPGVGVLFLLDVGVPFSPDVGVPDVGVPFSPDEVHGTHSDSSPSSWGGGQVATPPKQSSAALSPPTQPHSGTSAITTPDTDLKAMLSPVPLTHWLQIQVSTVPSWGSVTLLLQLSELRGIFGPLDYQFIIKGCNGNILIEEMQKAK